MKVALLGLEFAIENMGCQALAYSFTNLFEKCSCDPTRNNEYKAIVYRGFSDVYVNEKRIDCVVMRVKKVSFWRYLWKTFKNSDLIVDFTGGDSFSDVYGMKRFLIGSVIKRMAIASGTKFMLGPQTYGPFKRRLSKIIAQKIIKKSEWVFARDGISKQYAETLSGRTVKLTTDVAFSLPYKKTDNETGTKKIGFNVSGLLWSGGYSKTPLMLKVDYQTYCRDIIGYLLQDDKNEIHLIPHVGVTPDGAVENDMNACLLLQREFPAVIVEKSIKSPMDAKNIIASMDVFIGARMHATIAAFSSGVATIPFSYSRKFEGLYGNLGYDYIISALNDTTEDALAKTIEWVTESSKLKEDVERANESIIHFQESFEESLTEIIESLGN